MAIADAIKDGTSTRHHVARTNLKDSVEVEVDVDEES